MHIIDSLVSLPLLPGSVITIGNFDGVHGGHQTVLKEVTSRASQKKTKSIAITFSNHPLSIITPEKTLRMICTLEHKLHLLEKLGIDIVLLLPFTKEFSELAAEDFLKMLFKKANFSELVLGHDAVLGKNREGTKEKVGAYGKELGFEVLYLAPFSLEGVTISSSKIKHAIAEGDFAKASLFLGRPYSIYSHVVKGAGLGEKLNCHTANFPVDSLILPPLGVYSVGFLWRGKMYKAIANLGIAPTVRHDQTPLLEVHLLEPPALPLLSEQAEVFFHKFIRPEMKFPSLDALKAQIQKDISSL